MPSDKSPTCLITGAAGGIGRALVVVFREAGYRVIATDRVEIPHDLDCDGYVQADLQTLVESPSYAEEVFGEIRSHLRDSELQALINNAAIQILGGAGSLTRNDWHETLDVNLVAPFLIAQGFLAELEKAGGAVVNISSIHARLTKESFVAYATSKAALSGMTRALAVDLGPRVSVNAIEPAAVATQMLKDGFRDNPEGLDVLAKYHPVGRVAETSEIAHLALAIVSSPAAGFLTGACIELSGGIAARLAEALR